MLTNINDVIRKFWSGIGLQRRLAISLGLLLFIAASVQAHLTIRSAASGIKFYLTQELDNLLPLLTPLIAEHVIIGDFASIRQMLGVQAAHRVYIERIVWIDPHGSSLEVTGHKTEPVRPQWFSNYLSISLPPPSQHIVLGGVDYGTFTINISAIPAENLLWEQFVNNLWQLFLIIFLVFFITSIVLRRNLAAVRNLVVAAKKLGSGELSMRTGLSHDKDEIGELASTFDSMADALQKLNEDLEDRVALRTRQLEEALESQKQRTLVDPLTNLPNRLLFNDRLTQAILKAEQDQKILAVAFIDIDDFKIINDVYGHLGGDTVLKWIGARLKSTASPDSTVARIGGDEFALVITAQSKEKIMDTINMLYKTLVAPIDIGSRSREISVSIGIAYYPDHGHSQPDLMDRADVAMYSAKQETGGVRIYTPDTDRDRRSRMSMIDDVRGAIGRDEIKLYYQPQYDYMTGKIVGAVGVARWEHPKLGIVKPLVFMSIVHDSGLTKSLTRRLIEAAVFQVMLWKKQNIELPISVKVDADSITDQDLSSYVEGLLSKYNVNPKMLEFAIQESALMLSPTLTREVLSRLQRLGVSITIEEFGSGYGSIGWITNTIAPLSLIKISRKYILGMPSNKNYMTYIQSLINVAHALKLKVVADGVEDEATWEELKTLGCDFALGYYHSRPISPSDFEKWYKKDSPVKIL